MASKTQPSVTALQEQIFAREGFRVSFERLGAAEGALPAYDYPVMAPQGWKVSDWKRMRLGAYLLHFKSATVYGGDGEPLRRDVKLGHLRDGYYESQYGTLAPEDGNVIPLRRKD